jgi:hypothetical protein
MELHPTHLPMPQDHFVNRWFDGAFQRDDERRAHGLINLMSSWNALAVPTNL